MERFVNLEELEGLMQECESYEFNGMSGKYIDYKWYTFIMENEEVQVYAK